MDRVGRGGDIKYQWVLFSEDKWRASSGLDRYHMRWLLLRVQNSTHAHVLDSSMVARNVNTNIEAFSKKSRLLYSIFHSSC